MKDDDPNQSSDSLVRRVAELEDRERQLQDLLRLQEQDRQLAAFEIHDTFLQDVIGALMLIDAFCESRRAAGDERLEQPEMARRLLRKSVERARNMISGLRPAAVGEQGLLVSLELALNEARSRGLDIRLLTEGNLHDLSPLTESTALRIIQEGLRNIERHSNSPRADVSLAQREKVLWVEIRDFGLGFDPKRVASGHFGLQGIKERAKIAGGTAKVVSAPGQGTVITFEIPLRTPADETD